MLYNTRMAQKPIIQVPDQILTTPCDKVRIFGDETKALAQDLVDTLNAAIKPQGAGLAAPQIGVTARVCVVRRFFADPAKPSQELHKDYALVNPKITSESGEFDIDWEGCLSIPNTYGRVKRSRKIKVMAFDEKGNVIKLKASGFFARVIQHELDHLDGVLFTSKVVGDVMTEEALDKLYEGVPTL